jgi:RNA polymerase sigma-70 factor (ECF subfamily)
MANVMLDYDSLIVSSANGDMTSFETLYDELFKGVFALALSITRDYGLSEDIVQDTFIKIRVNGSRLVSKGFGKAWIYKIARNLSINAINSRKHDVYSDATENQADTISNTIVDSVLLQKALQVLSQIEQQTVLLHAVGGMLHKDISSILEIPLSTVKWNYRNAIKKLEVELREVQ